VAFSFCDFKLAHPVHAVRILAMDLNPYESPEASEPSSKAEIPHRPPRKTVIWGWCVCIAIAFVHGMVGFFGYGMLRPSGTSTVYQWVHWWTFFIYPPVMIAICLIQIRRELKGLRGFIWQNK
jgi:hypothetical protein